MTEKQNIPYPSKMLSGVRYSSLDEDMMATFTLVNLEANTMRRCSDFVDQLEKALLKADMVQNSEMIVSHLCIYLGSMISVFSHEKSKSLEPGVQTLVKEHAELSLSKFKHYLAGLNEENKSQLLENLREDAPGSIIVQTIRLGRIVKDMMYRLTEGKLNFTRKQKDFFCPDSVLLEFLIPLLNEQYEEWKEDLGGKSINYPINQLAIQIGWLIGYFTYLDKKDTPKLYFDYGLHCISIYIKHINKFQRLSLKSGISLVEVLEFQ